MSKRLIATVNFRFARDPSTIPRSPVGCEEAERKI